MHLLTFYTETVEILHSQLNSSKELLKLLIVMHLLCFNVSKNITIPDQNSISNRQKVNFAIIWNALAKSRIGLEFLSRKISFKK